jgi:hypothetical protein
MAAVIVLGTALGVAFTRMMSPEYEVHATIWISAETPQEDEQRSGPIRAAELLHEASWPELLTSFAILPGDHIVLTVPTDSALSDTFVVRAGGSDGPVLRLPNLPEIPLRGVLRSELKPHLVEHVGRS